MSFFQDNTVKTTLIWVLASTITLASAYYQRRTGPTYPVRGSVEIESETISYKLLRSNYSTSNAVMEIGPVPLSVRGGMRWRRLRSHDDWHVDSLLREGNRLVAEIPKQPPAGKIAYEITLIDSEGERFSLSDEPVVIRFKGEVPTIVLILHVITIFTSMLLGTRTGLEALFKRDRSYRVAVSTAIFLFLGGIILGPIVQKYAFGAFWTGWPLGSDLTDNKTAVALLGWLVALWLGRKPETGRKWFIIAALIQFVVFIIPHSLLGSELDYTQLDKPT